MSRKRKAASMAPSDEPSPPPKNKKLTKAEKLVLIEKAKQAVYADTMQSPAKRARTTTAARSTTKKAPSSSSKSNRRRQSEPLPKKTPSKNRRQSITEDLSEDDDEESEKQDVKPKAKASSSKKKQLSEARARAAVWAKEQKEKKKVAATTTPVRKSPAPMEEEPSPVSSIDDSMEDSTIESVSSESMVTAKETQQKETKAKTMSTKKKQEQLARAAAWANEQRKQKSKSSTTPSRKTTAPPPSQYVQVSHSSLFRTEAEETEFPPQVAQQPPRIEFSPQAAQQHTRTEFSPSGTNAYATGTRFAASSPPDAAAGLGRRVPVMLPQQQPSLFSNQPTTATASQIQDLLASPNIEDIVRQLKERERRESEQVQATQTRMAREAVEAAAVMTEHQEQLRPSSEVEEEYEEEKQASWVQSVLETVFSSLVVVFLLARFSMLVAQHDSTSVVAPWKADSSGTKLPPCFKSTIDSIEGASEPPEWLAARGIESCHQGKTVPCPEGGICSGGYLRACHVDYFEPAETGEQCVFTNEANRTLAQLEAALVNLTVDHVCSFLSDCELVKDRSGVAPMFALEDVNDRLQDVQVDPLLLSMPSQIGNLQVKQENNTVLVGLTEDYVNRRLPLPTACWCFRLVMDTVALFWSGFFLPLFWFAIMILKALMRVAVKYPIASLAVVFVLWFGRYVVNRRRKRAQLNKEVAMVTQLAYDKLMSCHSYTVLMLRDQIAHDLYPTSKAKRDYVNSKVWPLVVYHVKRDNRVLKSITKERGKPRDVWSWVAPKTDEKKRV